MRLKAAKDGSTSRLMASGNKCVPTRWGSRRRQSAARWGSPTQTLARCRRGSNDHEQKPSVSVRTVTCVCGWTGRVEGFDSSGVRVCICANVGGVATGATQNRRHVHDDDTETRAQRADLGEAVFRVEVAERFDLGFDGSTDTRAPVRWGSRLRHGGTSNTVTDR
jgi:hypothetical protein